MYTSILQYLMNGLSNLETKTEEFYERPETFSDFARQVKENVLELGCRILAENLTAMDQAIRESLGRKEEWSIVRKDRAGLLTSVGSVRYQKTLFQNKRTGKRAYLLDQLMELEPHERITADAVAEIYEEAAEGSYRKGGQKAVPLENLSKETVKNKIHALEFPEPEPVKEKKRVKNLYVEADEDHVSLQFLERRGDLERDEKGRKGNGCLVKLVYVHEGTEPESEGSKRKRLKGARYFGGVREGSEENRKLWEEVEEHIRSHYDLEEGGHVFLSGDGAGWIQTGKEILGKDAVLLLDGYHLQKYVNRATSHMGDSKEDARERLRKAVEEADEEEAKRLFGILKGHAKTEGAKKRLEESERYILGNWERIEAGKRHEKETHGCSAEGHVSHLLSDRMSSRPLGWSKQGADRMSRLRIYAANGGNFDELAQYQRKERRKAAEGAKRLCAPGEIMKSERRAKKEIERNYDKLQKRLASPQLRKMAAIRLRVTGL